MPVHFHTSIVKYYDDNNSKAAVINVSTDDYGVPTYQVEWERETPRIDKDATRC